LVYGGADSMLKMLSAEKNCQRRILVPTRCWKRRKKNKLEVPVSVMEFVEACFQPERMVLPFNSIL